MKIKRYGIVFLLFIVLCLNGCEKNNGNNEKEELIEETGQNVPVEIENIEDLDTETSAVEDAPVRFRKIFLKKQIKNFPSVIIRSK